MAPSLRRGLAELKRRKVYHVAVAYLVAAFAVWQVADIAFPYLGLPDTAVTLVVVLTLLGFPLALVLAWAYEVRPEQPVPDTGSAALPEGATAPLDALLIADGSDEPAIAVLPFKDMATEAGSEYFTDGITEELTHALARVHGLRVAARTSAFAFKERQEDVRLIGRALGVQWVVEGSVRRHGERLRVTAQLIEAETGYHRWSERYERPLGDVFEVQDEIVDRLTATLLTQLPGHGAPPVPSTSDMAAYDAYLRGRHLTRRFDPAAVKAAERAFREAVDRDPEFAPGHAALAEVLIFQAVAFGVAPAAALMPEARESAERALALSPELPEAFLARGLVRFFHDWEFERARLDLERAASLSPSLVDAYLWLEFYFTYIAHDYDRAAAALERALILDPLNPAFLDRRGTLRMIRGWYGEAEADFRDVIERGGLGMGALGMADVCSRIDRLEEAVDWGRKALDATDPQPNAFLGVVGAIFGMAGRTGEATELLRELEGRDESGFVPTFWLACVHDGLGNTDEAFRLLDRAVDERDPNLIYLTVLPRLSHVWQDPRFPEVLRRVGLDHLLDGTLTETPPWRQTR